MGAMRLGCCAGMLCAIASGCASYEARPLSREAVERALAAPDAGEAAEASRLALGDRWPAAFDPSRGVTPDTAAVLAVVVHPSLRAARDERNLARAQLVQAGILPNPEVSVGLVKPVGARASGEVVGADLGVSWEISSLISLDANVQAARAGVAQADLGVAWSEWEVAESARLATLDLQVLDEEVALRREIEAQEGAALTEVRGAVDRGESTIADLAAAEAASQQASAELLGAEAASRAQRLALRRALGIPSDSELAIAPLGPLAWDNPLPSREALVAGLEERRLDLLALRMGYESQEERLRAAVLQQFPRISIGPTASRDSGNFYTLGLGATISIPLFDRNQGQIAIETATREQLFDEYVQRLFEARADLTEAIDTIESLRLQIAGAEASLPVFQRLAERYDDALRRGDIDALTAYAARTALVQKRVDILELRRQLGEGIVALELASGVFVPLDGTAATPDGATP